MIESVEFQLDAKAPIRFVTREHRLFCSGVGWEFMLCETRGERGCDVTYGQGTLDIFLIRSAVTATWRKCPLVLEGHGFSDMVIAKHSMLAWIKKGTGLQPIHIEVKP